MYLFIVGGIGPFAYKNEILPFSAMVGPVRWNILAMETQGPLQLTKAEKAIICR